MTKTDKNTDSSADGVDANGANDNAENEKMTTSTLFGDFAAAYEERQAEDLSLVDYLKKAQVDASYYASPAERMLTSFGEPEVIETSKDPRLSRIFSNEPITRYSAFAHLHGMEPVIQEIVDHLTASEQNLEEKRQIPYFLGPAGSGKSTVTRKMMQLFETQPFYAIKGSPIHESPLALFAGNTQYKELLENYGIPESYIPETMSPWLAKRVKEAKGDIEKFEVEKLFPSKLDGIAMARTEPGDENNQDISDLIGGVDIRMIEEFSQNDADAYSFHGGLNKANQGVLEFVEMFKAPLKTLNPLLTAPQEGVYEGNNSVGAIPFDGIVFAHSNEAEWAAFKGNKNNEAFIDRVNLIKVPYVLRVTEEMEIYRGMLQSSSLADAPCAPGTLRALAQITVLSRLVEPENSSVYSKMRVYDGESLKDEDPKAKSLLEYKTQAGLDEGMTGLSTRFGMKVLSKAFNKSAEVAADPVHLFYALEEAIENEQFPAEKEQALLAHLKGYIVPQYAKFLGEEIQEAQLEAYHEYGQNVFDRYVLYADWWGQDTDYRDPDTGEMLNRDALDAELKKTESMLGTANVKDFRNEVVNFCLRYKANNNGENPDWKSYKKLANVIKHKMFSNMEDMMPIISFSKKASPEDQKKHEDFVGRMVDGGYTEKQVHLLSEWYMKHRKSAPADIQLG